MKFIPQIRNLGFNNESVLNIPRLAKQQQDKITAKIDTLQYERFVKNKFIKPVTDIYAMYSPYSESYRAFYPFIDFLKKTLKKGDVIVDLSNRTGWSAFLLAGLFPQQKIISCWEGNTDVLGYNGFDFWFNQAKTISNLEICFTKLNEKLPFETESARVIFGFDILHHQIQSTLIDEIFRVIQSDGFIFFPHVHLANNEPEPFFKRGGDLVHGLEYQQIFDQNTKGFSTFVYAEADLFLFQKGVFLEIQPEPSTLHYNGLVVLAPSGNSFQEKLYATDFLDQFGLEKCNAIFNYLFEINNFGQISESSDKILQEHMERHPVYRDVLNRTNDYQLNDLERKIIYWVRKGFSLKQIQSILAIDTSFYKTVLKNLESLEIIQILPVSQSALRLQIYHATQKWIEPEGDHTLPALWKSNLKLYPENIYLTDDKAEISYTYQETDQIIKHIVTSFIKANLKPGSIIMLDDGYSVVSFSIFWAAMHMGLICIPFKSSISETEVNDLVQKYEPEIVFSEKELILSNSVSNIFYDETDQNESLNHFPFWLADEPTVFESNVQESDVAVILCTSGSNGAPKGVKLNHAQLFQSAANMVEAYHWTGKDRFLALGSLESMSGLRNACIVPVKCGCSVVIADREDLHLASRIVGQISEHNITVFSGSPVLYHQLLQIKNLKQQLRSLRLVLSTGSKLSENLKTRFFETTALRIKNYYGLTETSGICIAQRLSQEASEDDCIGVPVDALIKVKSISISGEVKTGELYIYSGNISKGYYEIENAMDVDVDGWLSTKDIVSVDKNGEVYLKGRSENFIKTQRSEIIYLAQIEAIIDPLISGDYELITFVKNEAEYLGLFLISGQEDIKQTEKLILDRVNQTFGIWKVPLEFFQVDSIPRKQNGKLNKQRLLEIV